MSLKHANQFALFLLYPTILANIGFDDLKSVILMSVTNYILEHREIEG